ncbi:YdeI family protein [Duganella sp. Root198D2]|uniref:YdeI/OmpD-associated family protein n=1 Tax=Duganella sp. Root198D2 TaxID=1736489 RepID=UPI00070C7E78|nr:YdeI/OmpD-associated family protein [Duganella sp. Root198D2]KRB83843.1 hypothetical protein ASE26_11650 [Duganella sp. Root198D2]
MPTTDPRVDEYIANAAEFAQPILNYLREVIHAACPEVKETIKWSMPNFEYHGIVCSFAAFKQHCALNFWKAELLIAAESDKSKEAMGQFGRIASIKDLPPKKELTAYIKKAMKLNEQGVKVTRQKAAPRELLVPDYFIAALEENPAAYEVFNEFSTSAKRDYCDWLTEAKTEATRDKRMAQAVEWIAEGKKRHWKHQSC